MGWVGFGRQGPKLGQVSFSREKDLGQSGSGWTCIKYSNVEHENMNFSDF